jgi:hypothetical protein
MWDLEFKNIRTQDTYQWNVTMLLHVEQPTSGQWETVTTGLEMNRAERQDMYLYPIYYMVKNCWRYVVPGITMNENA